MLSETSWSRIKGLVKKRDGETCVYCGRISPDGEPDHVLPLEKGGHDALDNLVWSCPNCNRSKQGKTLRQWFKQIVARRVEKKKLFWEPRSLTFDYKAEGWDCDCGGFGYVYQGVIKSKVFVVVMHEGQVMGNWIQHGHHAPGCPILAAVCESLKFKTREWCTCYSPYYSLIANGIPVLKGHDPEMNFDIDEFTEFIQGIPKTNGYCVLINGILWLRPLFEVRYEPSINKDIAVYLGPKLE